MNHRTNLKTKKMPVALACGVLEDNGRTLFLVRSELRNGKESKLLELPSVLTYAGENIAFELANAFAKQTGIDAQVGRAFIEAHHNVGSRKRPHFIPAFAFRLTAKKCTARPSNEFAGFKWLTFETAKNELVSRNTEWLKKLPRV